MPDLLRVPVVRRHARLAGRGPPEGSGKRWKSGHAVLMLPEKSGMLSRKSDRLPKKSGMLPGKSGESPNSDGHGAAWFISPWRSDGAFLGETLPRVKVFTRSDHSAGYPRGNQAPARHISKLAGATRTAMRSRRGGSFPKLASQAPTRPIKGSRAAGEDQGIAENRFPRKHRRSGVTMAQTVPHRKRIVQGRHEAA